MDITPRPKGIKLSSTQLNDDTSSTSTSKTTFSQISPILFQDGDYPYFPSPPTTRPTSTSNHALTSPHPSRPVQFPLNNISYLQFLPHQSLGTAVLRRSVSERAPRPDSGVSFTSPNGLHNAKASARAMDRALTTTLQRHDSRGRTKHRSPPRTNLQRRSNEGRRGRDHIQKAVWGAQHEMDDNRENRSHPRYRHTQDLAALPSTSTLNPIHTAQKTAKGKPFIRPRFSSLRRNRYSNTSRLPDPPDAAVDEIAARFRDIEAASEEIRKEILESQLNRISRAAEEMEPLQRVPRREVEVVVSARRRDRSMQGALGNVLAEGEVDVHGDGTKKEGKLRRVLGRAKTICRRKRNGKAEAEEV